LAAAAAACAPDLDLVLHLLGATHHHRGPSHSIGAALLAGVLAFLAARLRSATRPATRLGTAVGAGWLSHVLLDWLGSDSRPPLGIMALWPLSDAYYLAPIPIFMDVAREISWPTVGHNLVAMAWECVLLVPVLLAARRSRRKEA
jgi:membrane-bound metal-dependent hydrolase YbcI (DUF457 family)